MVCRLAGLKKEDADEIRKRPDLAEWLDRQLAEFEAHYETTAPVRTDDRDTAAPYLGPVYTSHDRSVFTHKEMHAILIEQFGPICWGCDFDGSIYEERGPRYLELDHVNPKSSGGHDHLDNRALLCGPCNREKSDRQTLIQLRRSTMGARRARNHRINLESAGRWCRATPRPGVCKKLKSAGWHRCVVADSRPNPSYMPVGTRQDVCVDRPASPKMREWPGTSSGEIHARVIVLPVDPRAARALIS